MEKLKYIKLKNEDGSYTDSIPLAVDSDYVDINGNTLTNELNNKANNSSINNLQNQINKLASGSPLVASSTSGMIDTTRVYVNTTDGNWYYYNGDLWEIGGVYQATEDSDTVEELQNDVDELKSNWDITSNLIDYKIEILKRLPTDPDHTITCTMNDDGVLTINGTCSSMVHIMLTDEEEDRFPDGDYVIRCDNIDYSGITTKYLEAAFLRYGHNQYNTYRYNNANTYTTINASTSRAEVELVRENLSSFTYDRNSVRFGINLSARTYNNVKIRIWLVKKGEDESYSKFGTLKDFIGNIKSIKLKSDHNLRFAVATDIHWNHDDTVNTGLNGYQKTQLLVDAINAEHHKKPIDFLFVTGDVNGPGETVNDLQEFKDKFLWKFEMPVVLFVGNHDPYTNLEWNEITGYNRRTSLETEDFYFIFEDTFGDNLGKTWLSHWAAYYQSGDVEAYIPCSSTDTGALLIGTDIQLADVTPIMRGWSYTPKNGDYVKLAKAKDADMYKSPSLDYVKQEVAKAGDKYIIFVSHQILGYSDGDEEGVKTYLDSLDNFLFYLEGHAHIYYDAVNASGKWTLNSGHFYVPAGGWANVASNNYRGFRIIEIDDNKLKTYKIQPTQNVGTQYEHQYDIVAEHNLFNIEKNARADIDLLKLSKDKEYSNKLSDLETRLSDIENVSNN